MSVNTSALYEAVANDQFVAGVGSAVVFWLLTSGGNYLYKRWQVRKLLLFEVNDQIRGIFDAIADLGPLIDKKIVPGQPLTQGGRFIPAHSSFFEALQGDLLHLFPVATKHILTTYHVLEMVQHLIVGLYEELTAEAAGGKPITLDEKSYYEGKLVRIMTMLDELGPIPMTSFSLPPAIRKVSAEEIRTLIERCPPGPGKKRRSQSAPT